MNVLADVVGAVVALAGNLIPYVVAAFVASRRTAPFRIPAALATGAYFYVMAMSTPDASSYYALIGAAVTALQVWVVSRLYAGVFVLLNQSRSPRD